MLRNAIGGVDIWIRADYCYEDTWYNVINVMGRWGGGVNFPEKSVT